MSRSNPLSVPYGNRVPKACLPCARVKARCEIVAGVETCKRCRRLKKTCSSQSPGAHRRTKLPSFKVVEPEEPEDTPDTGSLGQSPAVFIDQVINSDSEGEMILQAFRKDMEPQFPFVLTSPSMSFADLKEQKPLLVLAVLMVGLRGDQIRRTTIARKIRDIVGYDLLIRSQANFDLLQCLLIYVNWYHLHLHLGSQLCNFVHLIMALSTELGLNKEASTNTSIPGFGRFGYFGGAGSVLNMTAPKGVSSRTLDERRAFLGCFFLTSVTSMCIRDIEPIRYSKYVDECCCVLIEAMEVSTDISVAHLTRLHGLAQKIHTFTLDDNYMTTNFNAAPIGACVKALEADLLRLKKSFQEGFHHNAPLLIHYHVVEISLYERAIDPKEQSSENGTYPFMRLHMLSACLESIRLCLDVFHSIPHSQLFDVSYTTLTFLSHAIVILSKLSLLRTKDWDDAYAQSVLNFAESMDRIIRQVNDAKALAENTAEGDKKSSLVQTVPKLFSMLPDTLQKVKFVHEAMYAAQISSTDQGLPLDFAEFGGTLTEDEFLKMSAPSFSDFFVEDFLQHLTWS